MIGGGLVAAGESGVGVVLVGVGRVVAGVVWTGVVLGAGLVGGGLVGVGVAPPPQAISAAVATAPKLHTMAVRMLFMSFSSKIENVCGDGRNRTDRLGLSPAGHQPSSPESRCAEPAGPGRSRQAAAVGTACRPPLDQVSVTVGSFHVTVSPGTVV